MCIFFGFFEGTKENSLHILRALATIWKSLYSFTLKKLYYFKLCIQFYICYHKPYMHVKEKLEFELLFPYMKKEMQITLCTTVCAFVVCTIMMGPNCLHYQEYYSASSIIFPHGNAHSFKYANSSRHLVSWSTAYCCFRILLDTAKIRYRYILRTHIR